MKIVILRLEWLGLLENYKLIRLDILEGNCFFYLALKYDFKIFSTVKSEVKAKGWKTISNLKNIKTVTDKKNKKLTKSACLYFQIVLSLVT